MTVDPAPDHHRPTDRGQASTPRPLYSPTEHNAADRRAVEGGTAFDELVNRAGAAVADAVCESPRPQAVVLCGPGNNGADGRVAAELLRERGVAVEVRDWPNAAAFVAADLDSLVEPDGVTIIDGLLGSGLSRPVDDEMAAVFDAIGVARSRGARIVAIDVPSGLDGETGSPNPVAVAADATVTFSYLKPGHVLLPGRALCGEVQLRSIGIPPDAFDPPTLWENTPALWTLPQRGTGDHKYSAGHCLVVSGDRWHTGASRLTALAALRIGAGAVTVVGDVEAMAVHAHHLTEVMLHPVSGHDDVARFVVDRRINTIAIGPALGMDATANELLEVSFASAATVVADADAITIMGHDRDRWLQRSRSHGRTILTPHQAEFERLFGPERGTQDQSVDHGSGSGKVALTRHAAATSGAVIVHKGPDTVVAAPDGRAVVNTNAPPSLATAGSGDVLTGIIVGLVTQGMDLFDAACAGVWLHGDAATRGPERLIASDLLDALRVVHPGRGSSRS